MVVSVFLESDVLFFIYQCCCCLLLQLFMYVKYLVHFRFKSSLGNFTHWWFPTAGRMKWPDDCQDSNEVLVNQSLKLNICDIQLVWMEVMRMFLGVKQFSVSTFASCAVCPFRLMTTSKAKIKHQNWNSTPKQGTLSSLVQSCNL